MSIHKDRLLRLAYELLWREHRITAVEVGEAFGINEAYHKDSCDVCDLLKDINKELEPKRPQYRTPPGRG